MNRLYNEFHAAPCVGAVAKLNDILEEAIKEVWEVIEAEDLDLRDAELFCYSTMSGLFAEAILTRQVKMRKSMARDFKRLVELTEKVPT